MKWLIDWPAWSKNSGGQPYFQMIRVPKKWRANLPRSKTLSRTGVSQCSVIQSMYHSVINRLKTHWPQRFLYTCMDVKGTSQYCCSFLLCWSRYFLFMGGGSVSHSLTGMPPSFDFTLVRRVLQFFLPSASDSKVMFIWEMGRRSQSRLGYRSIDAVFCRMWTGCLESSPTTFLLDLKFPMVRGDPKRNGSIKDFFRHGWQRSYRPHCS